MIEELIKSKFSAIFLIIISGIVLSPHLFNHSSAGLPLIVLGATIYFSGRHTMGRVWSVRIEPKNELVCAGLFRHIRHPLYSGLLLACIGLIISTFSLYFAILFTFVIAPYLYIRARLEEKVLKSTHPDYAEYMKRTKMFIPKVL